MFLNDMLARLRESSRTAEIDAAYQEFLARLDAGEVAAQALQVGERMPGFLLPNAEGALVESAELLAQGPVVATFFRGDWCPYCTLTMQALEAALPELRAAGGTLVGFTPETGGRSLAAKRERALHFEVLVDVDLAIAMQFGIVFRTPPLYARLLARNGIDLAARSGNPGWFLPVPATFLIDRGGVVRQRWIDIDFTRRAEPSAVIEALRAL